MARLSSRLEAYFYRNMNTLGFLPDDHRFQWVRARINEAYHLTAEKEV